MTGTLDPSKLVFAGTASRRGRTISVSPANSDLDYLHYGRIILGPGEPRAAFASDARETALLCMHGACSVTVDGARHAVLTGEHPGITPEKFLGSRLFSEVNTALELRGLSSVYWQLPFVL